MIPSCCCGGAPSGVTCGSYTIPARNLTLTYAPGTKTPNTATLTFDGVHTWQVTCYTYVFSGSNYSEKDLLTCNSGVLYFKDTLYSAGNTTCFGFGTCADTNGTAPCSNSYVFKNYVASPFKIEVWTNPGGGNFIVWTLT